MAWNEKRFNLQKDINWDETEALMIVNDIHVPSL